MELYRTNNLKCSKITTESYSTSFSLGIRMLKKKYRPGIYAIYGFVRYADELVDTFFGKDQKTILAEFTADTKKAIERGFSINPIIDSFQWAVKKYGIETAHIEAFLYSMNLDLEKKTYTKQELKTYIYGSAEVIGLMCLRVFYYKQPEKYNALVYPACKLGEAFQKVNFLRDTLDDYSNKGRSYFEIDYENFTIKAKKEIEDEIAADFAEALQGIKKLYKPVRFGVYLAYLYYQKLLNIIRETPPELLLSKRCRVPDHIKFWLLIRSGFLNFFNLI
jgi:15-cis-phytoene synthase